MDQCFRCEMSTATVQCEDCASSEPEPVIYCDECSGITHIGKMAKHRFHSILLKEKKEDTLERYAAYTRECRNLELRVNELEQLEKNVQEILRVHERNIRRRVVELQDRLKKQAGILMGQLKDAAKVKVNKITQAREELVKQIQEMKECGAKVQDVLDLDDFNFAQTAKEEGNIIHQKWTRPDIATLDIPSAWIDYKVDFSPIENVIESLKVQFQEGKPKDLVLEQPNFESGEEIPVLLCSSLQKNGTFSVSPLHNHEATVTLHALSLQIRSEILKKCDWMTYGCQEQLPSVNDLVFARHPCDKKWYRARVREKPKGPQSDVMVMFLDYGNLITVGVESLLPYRELAPDCKFQAVVCSMFDNVDIQLSVDPVWLFHDLTQHRNCFCRAKQKIDNANMWQVDLFVQKERESSKSCINEQILSQVESSRVKGTLMCRDIRYLDQKPNIEILQTGAQQKTSQDVPTENHAPATGPAEGSTVPETEHTDETKGGVKPTDQQPQDPEKAKPTDQQAQDPEKLKPTDQQAQDPEKAKPTDQQAQDPEKLKPTDQQAQDPEIAKPTDQQAQDPEKLKPTDQQPQDPEKVKPQEPDPDKPKPQEQVPEEVKPSPAEQSECTDSDLPPSGSGLPLTELVHPDGVMNQQDLEESIQVTIPPTDRLRTDDTDNKTADISVSNLPENPQESIPKCVTSSSAEDQGMPSELDEPEFDEPTNADSQVTGIDSEDIVPVMGFGEQQGPPGGEICQQGHCYTGESSAEQTPEKYSENSYQICHNTTEDDLGDAAEGPADIQAKSESEGIDSDYFPNHNCTNTGPTLDSTETPTCTKPISELIPPLDNFQAENTGLCHGVADTSQLNKVQLEQAPTPDLQSTREDAENLNDQESAELGSVVTAYYVGETVGRDDQSQEESDNVQENISGGVGLGSVPEVLTTDPENITQSEVNSVDPEVYQTEGQPVGPELYQPKECPVDQEVYQTPDVKSAEDCPLSQSETEWSNSCLNDEVSENKVKCDSQTFKDSSAKSNEDIVYDCEQAGPVQMSPNEKLQCYPSDNPDIKGYIPPSPDRSDDIENWAQASLYAPPPPPEVENDEAGPHTAAEGAVEGRARGAEEGPEDVGLQVNGQAEQVLSATSRDVIPPPGQDACDQSTDNSPPGGATEGNRLPRAIIKSSDDITPSPAEPTSDARASAAGHKNEPTPTSVKGKESQEASRASQGQKVRSLVDCLPRVCMCERVMFRAKVVSDMDTEGMFWMQLARETPEQDNAYRKFEQQLQEYGKLSLQVQEPKRSSMVLADYKGMFHRALFLQTKGASRAMVQLIDIGQRVTVALTALRDINQNLEKYPNQAVECCLQTAEYSTFNDEARKLFSRLVKDKILDVIVERLGSHGLFAYVKVFDNTEVQSINIYSQICQEGAAGLTVVPDFRIPPPPLYTSSGQLGPGLQFYNPQMATTSDQESVFMALYEENVVDKSSVSYPMFKEQVLSAVLQNPQLKTQVLKESVPTEWLANPSGPGIPRSSNGTGSPQQYRGDDWGPGNRGNTHEAPGHDGGQWNSGQRSGPQSNRASRQPHRDGNTRHGAAYHDSGSHRQPRNHDNRSSPHGNSYDRSSRQPQAYDKGPSRAVHQSDSSSVTSRDTPSSHGVTSTAGSVASDETERVTCSTVPQDPLSSFDEEAWVEGEGVPTCSSESAEYQDYNTSYNKGYSRPAEGLSGSWYSSSPGSSSNMDTHRGTYTSTKPGYRGKQRNRNGTKT